MQIAGFPTEIYQLIEQKILLYADNEVFYGTTISNI